MKKSRSFICYLTLLSTLSACNLYGGLSSPSGDEQHLDAARACLDQNDYPCALEHYSALSGSSFQDTKINETSLAELAQAKVFSFSDLISSLGTALGSGSSFSAMAKTIASQNAMNGVNRALIQQTFANNNLITTSQLRGFSRFISSLAMINTILASAIGPDGMLTATDIASGGVACASANFPYASCGDPGNDLDPSNVSDPANLSALGWENAPTLGMLWKALIAANTEVPNFITGSSSGIFSSINDVLSVGALASDQLKRKQLIIMLGLQ